MATTDRVGAGFGFCVYETRMTPQEAEKKGSKVHEKGIRVQFDTNQLFHLVRFNGDEKEICCSCVRVITALTAPALACLTLLANKASGVAESVMNSHNASAVPISYANIPWSADAAFY